MLLEARIQEGDIYRVARDQKAEIRLDAFPDSVFQGAVAALGALTVAEKSESRSFPLRVQVLGSDSRLRPGMAARATIDCGDIDNALLVPVDAVQISGDQKSCLVRGLAGGATRRLIKTGKSNTFFFEVAAGLKEGETVLVQRH
jgi:multidrug efflux pump subunit AcrA (membrane-fusion protein)